MSNQLPSWIKPNTADAYNYAYTMLYCRQSKDVRDVIDKAKSDENTYRDLWNNTSYGARTACLFFKEVKRMAEYELSYEDLKALERREKIEGIHPSQQKPISTDYSSKPKNVPPQNNLENENPS